MNLKHSRPPRYSSSYSTPSTPRSSPNHSVSHPFPLPLPLTEMPTLNSPTFVSISHHPPVTHSPSILSLTISSLSLGPEHPLNSSKSAGKKPIHEHVMRE